MQLPSDPPSAEPVLSVEGATHRFGPTVALDGVDLQVVAGECVALLGPNGAGKTTLVGQVTGLLAPGAGTIRVVGGDPRRAATRRQLGVVQQSIGFPRTLTVAELVRGAVVRRGLPARSAGPLLAEVGITDLASRRAGKLSGGQQQRLQLAMALVGDPSLLVLDEPTVGLDVTARRAFWRTLQRRRDGGTGVLLTTHLVEEAGSIADRVAVLHRGRVLVTDTPAAMADRLPDRTIIARTSLTDDAVRELTEVTGIERRGDHVRLTGASPERIVRQLLAADADLSDLRVEGASLEEALVHLTAETPREVAA